MRRNARLSRQGEGRRLPPDLKRGQSKTKKEKRKKRANKTVEGVQVEGFTNREERGKREEERGGGVPRGRSGGALKSWLVINCPTTDPNTTLHSRQPTDDQSLRPSFFRKRWLKTKRRSCYYRNAEAPTHTTRNPVDGINRTRTPNSTGETGRYAAQGVFRKVTLFCIKMSIHFYWESNPRSSTNTG